MKVSVFWFIAATFCLISFGAETPLLKLEKVTGYVPPEYEKSFTCRIFSNRVKITRKSFNSTSTKTYPIQLELSTINEEISEAALGTIAKMSGPTDSPLTSYTASLNGKEVVLWENAVWEDRLPSLHRYTKKNESPSALTLIRFIFDHCRP